MKLFKNIFGVALIVTSIISLTLPQSVTAQAGRGFDLFEVPRAAIIVTPTNLLSGGAVATTNYIDRIGYAGVAKISLFSCTNSGNATNGCQVQSSPDQTNWFPLLYALATNIVHSTYTNSAYATANVFLFGTNIELLPAVPTTPAIASAGWGTPYQNAIVYTNTNWISFTTNAIIDIGFNISDANRYIRVIFDTYSNVSFGAELTGVKMGNY